MHRHVALALAAGVIGCVQPAEPPVGAVALSFERDGSPRYEIVDLGRFTPAGINSQAHITGTVGIDDDVHAVVWRDGAVKDLGTLPPAYPDASYHSSVTAINSRGQIVGWQSFFPPAEDVRAFLWDDGVMHDLNTPGGCCGGRNIAEAISHSGYVVGVTNAFGPLHAFLWRDGTMTDLGTLMGGQSHARDVNASGQVVGSSDGHAFLWENGVMRDLGTLGEGASEASKINDVGQVTGTSGTHAFFWSDGVMQDIGTLEGASSSSPVAINSRGQVAGNSGARGFLWDDGVLVSLGTLGGDRSVASDMNNATQVVGSSRVASGASHAFVWELGQMYDLGTLGGTESAAVAINNRGDVAGWAMLASGESHAVLWRRSTADADVAASSP